MPEEPKNAAYAAQFFRETLGKTPEAWRREQTSSVASVQEPAGKPTGCLERLTCISQADALRLQRLVGQLAPTAHFDLKALQKSLLRGETLLFVVRRRSQIAASISFVIFTTPTGNHCRVEDVIVDERHRGNGLGRKLMELAISVLRASRRADDQTSGRCA